MKKAKKVAPAIVARMPRVLVRRLDKASRENGRSRSAEIVQRLLDSFAASVAPTVAPPAGAEPAAAAVSTVVTGKGAQGRARAQVTAPREVTNAS